jgi:starvation-inducible DNA-binding protein
MGRNIVPGTNLKPQVLIQPNIGLDGDARKSVVEILNTLLADEGVLTMKTRGAHWHVRGPGFLEMQNLFEQHFQQLNIISNEIADRVRMLGGSAISSFEEFLKYTRLKEQPGDDPDFMGLLADHESSVRFLREDARKCFEEYEDHGTYALFVSFIGLHEKMAWILRSYIEPEVNSDENQRSKIRSMPR